MPALASSSPPWTAKMAPSTTTTTTTSSCSSSLTTNTNTSTTSSMSIQIPFQLLEINLISAQDLAHVSKYMRTYAVAWVDPNRKFTSRVGQQGHANPTWNDKFVLRVDDQFLTSDTSAIMVEIYTTSWLRHTLVGTVRVLINNLIPPSTRPMNNMTTRFVALQIRRPSGIPQGILYMGVSLLDTSTNNMTLASSAIGFGDIIDVKKNNDTTVEEFGEIAEEKKNKEGVKEDNDKQDGEKEEMSEKVPLWRSRSVGNDEDSPLKVQNGSSVWNGSMVNGSELYSDVGPSASIVAAEIAKGSYPQLLPPPPPAAPADAEADETGSSILEDLTVEEATAKGYKLKNESKRTESQSTDDHDLIVVKSNGGHPRRNSDGGGLFSCFGNAYGFEFTIVCGAPNYNNNNNSNNSNHNKYKKKRVGNSKLGIGLTSCDLRSHRSA